MPALSTSEFSVYKSVSFDIDGTLYPIRKIERRWWRHLFQGPKRAIRFYGIKRKWEKKRRGIDRFPTHPKDIAFFEAFLIALLDESFVAEEMKSLLLSLKNAGIDIYFLSDQLSCRNW